MLSGAACQSAKGEETPAAPRPVLIGSENVIIAKKDTIVAGPIISGELRPEREAVLRAQLGGSMLEDTRRSAQSAVRSAEQQLMVAEREMARTQQLVTAGALAAREVDLARNN